MSGLSSAVAEIVLLSARKQITHSGESYLRARLGTRAAGDCMGLNWSSRGLFSAHIVASASFLVYDLLTTLEDEVSVSVCIVVVAVSDDLGSV